MKIKVALKLVLYNHQAEHPVETGTTVRDFIDALVPDLPDKARCMLVDKQGIFRGVVLHNKGRADFSAELQDGDELILLAMISGG